MSTNRLGKGLRALIPEVENTADKSSVLEIPVDQIEPNPFQPRQHFDEDKLQQLADSIKQHGLLEPIIVRPKGQRYELVVGERRWRATQLANLSYILAVVKTLDDKSMMQLALIENLQRENLNPIEEAEGYRRLMDEFTFTQEEVAEAIGKKRSSVANALRLLNLDNRVRQMVEDGEISTGHAKVLLGVDNTRLRQRLAERIVREDLSVRQLEQLVRMPRNVPRRTMGRDDPEILRIQDDLQRVLGTKVAIAYKKGKGKIQIEYYSDEELERLLEQIKN